MRNRIPTAVLGLVLAAAPASAQTAAPAPAAPTPYRLPFGEGKSSWCSRSTHPGAPYAIDFAMPIGTPVAAAREGKVIETVTNVTETGPTLGGGNYVVIDHGDGTTARYLHLNPGQIIAKVGDWVEQGDIIAHSGNTGHSTGPHLHFQADKKGSWTSIGPIGFADVPGLFVQTGGTYVSKNTPGIPAATKDLLNQLQAQIALAQSLGEFSATKKLCDLALAVKFKDPAIRDRSPAVKSARETLDAMDRYGKTLWDRLDGIWKAVSFAATVREALLAERRLKGTPYAKDAAEAVRLLSSVEGWPEAQEALKGEWKGMELVSKAFYYELNQKPEMAVRYYKQYQEQVPGSPQAAAVGARIQALAPTGGK